MSRQTSSFGHRLGAYVCELERAVGGPLEAVMPASMFDEDEIDRHEWYRMTAERVGEAFAAQGCQPDLEIMLHGLVDYAEQSWRSVSAAFPLVQRERIHADMAELAIQLLSKTYASDGTRHARRSNGNRIRNLYLERMRERATGLNLSDS